MKIHRLILPSRQETGPVNAYLIEDGDFTLIDTGPRTPDTWAKLNQECRRLGLRLEDISKIIITHSHTDHCGMAGSIKEASGAKVHAHPLAAAWLRDPDKSLYDFFYTRGARFLRRMGTPEPVIATSFAWGEVLRDLTEAVQVDEVLNAGDRVEMGDCDWEVIYTPGHAMDSICLYNADSRLIFCGDQLLQSVPSNPLVEPPSSEGEERPHTLSIYLRSLRWLAEMDIAACFPGHGDAILNHRSVIRERLKRHDRRKQLILKVMGTGRKTPYEIAQSVVSSLEGAEVFLGISDILGHLDLMEEEDKVRLLEVDSVVYYEVC